jgi:hypothetical protein
MSSEFYEHQLEREPGEQYRCSGLADTDRDANRLGYDAWE